MRMTFFRMQFSELFSKSNNNHNDNDSNKDDNSKNEHLTDAIHLGSVTAQGALLRIHFSNSLL